MHHRTFVFDYIGSSPSPSPSPSPSTQEPPIKASDLHSGLDLDLGLGLGLGPRLGFTSAGKHKNDGEIKETDLDATSSPSVKTGVKRAYAEAKVKSNEIFPENVRQESVKSDDDLPSKGQVVGWPPVRYYRRHALTKPSEMFVKVNMDGVAVGRKVDLNAYSSYERLLQALEEMFQPTAAQMPFEGRENDPKHALTFNDSEFVLTYEDKDGDWMMVGDVPWSMFISSVRRLRITRGSETNSSAPTLSNKRGFHP